MAIARNKKPDPAAIAAFGAAAEHRAAETVEPAAPAAPAAKPAAPRGRATSAAKTPNAGPASTLVRWKGAEDVRDRIKAYAKSERYSEQEVAIQALRHGLDYLESQLDR